MTTTTIAAAPVRAVAGDPPRARHRSFAHVDKNSPIASVNPPYSFELVSTHANTRGAFN